MSNTNNQKTVNGKAGDYSGITYFITFDSMEGDNGVREYSGNTPVSTIRSDIVKHELEKITNEEERKEIEKQLNDETINPETGEPECSVYLIHNSEPTFLNKDNTDPIGVVLPPKAGNKEVSGIMFVADYDGVTKEVNVEADVTVHSGNQEIRLSIPCTRKVKMGEELSSDERPTHAELANYIIKNTNLLQDPAMEIRINGNRISYYSNDSCPKNARIAIEPKKLTITQTDIPAKQSEDLNKALRAKTSVAKPQVLTPEEAMNFLIEAKSIAPNPTTSNLNTASTNMPTEENPKGATQEDFTDHVKNHTNDPVILLPITVVHTDNSPGVSSYLILFKEKSDKGETLKTWSPFWPNQVQHTGLYNNPEGHLLHPKGFRKKDALWFKVGNDYAATCIWDKERIGVELPANWQVDQFNTAVKNIQRAKEQELQRAKEQEQRVEKYRRWRRISRTYDASRPLNTGRLSYLLPVNPLQTQRD